MQWGSETPEIQAECPQWRLGPRPPVPPAPHSSTATASSKAVTAELWARSTGRLWRPHSAHWRQSTCQPLPRPFQQSFGTLFFSILLLQPFRRWGRIKPKVKIRPQQLGLLLSLLPTSQWEAHWSANLHRRLTSCVQLLKAGDTVTLAGV